MKICKFNKGGCKERSPSVGVTCTEYNHPQDQASNKADKLHGLLHEEGLSDFLDSINIKLDMRLSTFACLFEG